MQIIIIIIWGVSHLHTDILWLLSLLGNIFTPLDLSSVIFFTVEVQTEEDIDVPAAGKYIKYIWSIYGVYMEHIWSIYGAYMENSQVHCS